MTFRTLLALSALAAALNLGACARWILPSSQEATETPYDTYEQAEQAFKRIVPFETSEEDLAAMGLHPRKTPNIKVVNYLEIMKRFLPQETVRLADLDPAVQACLNARDACKGWILAPERIARDRVGDVSLDVLGFDRETVSSGWRAEMVLLIVDGVVIYKLWSGTPVVQETKREVKPLGPFQDLSGAASGAAAGAIKGTLP